MMLGIVREKEKNRVTGKEIKQQEIFLYNFSLLQRKENLGHKFLIRVTVILKKRIGMKKIGVAKSNSIESYIYVIKMCTS